MNNKIKTVALILAVALITVGVAYAIYTMTTGTVNVTVSPLATMSLVANNTNLTVGDGLLLTATVSDSSNGLTVTFYQNSISIGTSTTSGGVATKTVTGLAAGSYSYYAEADHP